MKAVDGGDLLGGRILLLQVVFENHQIYHTHTSQPREKLTLG
jgi:hypothetical protein